MRKSTQFFLCLLAAGIFFSPGTAKAQVGQTLWQFSNPKAFGFSLFGSSFINNNDGLMVGENGGIAKTNDGGVTWGYFGWYELDANGNPFKPTWNDVQMVNSSVAYVVGTGGYMLKSIDGGLNWSKVNNPMRTANVEITGLSFLDANTGYIVGAPIGGNTNTGITSIYKTTNGGSTWTLEPNLPKLPAQRNGNGTSTPFTYDSSLAKSVWRVNFVRPNLGYAVGAGGLVWKYDGTGWKDYSITNFRLGLDTLASASRPTTGPQSQNYRSVAIISDTLVVVGSQSNGVIVRVNTAADTARPSLSVWSGFGINGGLDIGLGSLYSMVKANNGWIYSANGGSTFEPEVRYLISKDSGKTWASSPYTAPGNTFTGYGLRTISYSPNGRLIFGGGGGYVADSLNGVWRRQYKNVWPGAYYKIQFPDANNGIAAGSGMVRTRDGGANWENITNLNDANNNVVYYAMKYLTTDTMYLATSDGKVKVSYDQGTTFDQIFSDTVKTNANNGPSRIRAMDWINSQQGWVTSFRFQNGSNTESASSILFYTKDGGQTWDSTDTRTFYIVQPNASKPTDPDTIAIDITDIKFVNDKIGFATGTRGTIWKTGNGGLSWSLIRSEPTAGVNTMQGLFIVNPSTIYAAGQQARVFKTVDGGFTWQDIRSNLPTTAMPNFNGVLAYDKDQVFLIADGGNLWFSNSGGQWWNVYSPPVGGIRSLVGNATFAPINPGCGSPICNKLWLTAGQNILTYGSDKVLPVKFSQLTGTATQEGNQLFWTAYLQETVKYFEIEYSANGQDYTTVSNHITPLGGGMQAYTWRHKNAPAGKAYYRVKAVDIAGSVTYTNIVTLSSQSAPRWGYYVANDIININTAKALQGKVAVRVMNAAGQVIAAKEFMHPGGAFNNFVVLPQQAQGIHFVQVINEGTSVTFKAVIE